VTEYLPAVRAALGSATCSTWPPGADSLVAKVSNVLPGMTFVVVLPFPFPLPCLWIFTVLVALDSVTSSEPMPLETNGSDATQRAWRSVPSVRRTGEANVSRGASEHLWVADGGRSYVTAADWAEVQP
jgi:hypothetical protein